MNEIMSREFYIRVQSENVLLSFCFKKLQKMLPEKTQ